MFTKIIRNAAGTYEIRRWSIFGYSYWGDFRNGYWWSQAYRRNSLKARNADEARQAFSAAKERARQRAQAVRGDVVVSNLSSR